MIKIWEFYIKIQHSHFYLLFHACQQVVSENIDKQVYRKVQKCSFLGPKRPISFILGIRRIFLKIQKKSLKLCNWQSNLWFVRNLELGIFKVWLLAWIWSNLNFNEFHQFTATASSSKQELVKNFAHQVDHTLRYYKCLYSATLSF